MFEVVKHDFGHGPFQPRRLAKVKPESLDSAIFALMSGGATVGRLGDESTFGAGRDGPVFGNNIGECARVCATAAQRGVAESCSAMCASAKPAPGQCVAMVDYAGEATIADGVNPLYGISLRSISFEDAGRPQLEGFRRLLETARRGLEKDRKASKQRLPKAQN